MIKTIGLLGISLFVFNLSAWGLTGYDIMKKVSDRNTGDTTKSGLTMILIDKKKNQRKRQLLIWTVATNEVSKSLMIFESPPDMKGTGFLNINQKTGAKENKQWLYLPALQKVKRIASGDRGGSFLGSDFSYSDMGRSELDDFTYKLLKEQKVEGYETYKVEAIPKNDDVQKEFGYLKSISWVIKDVWLIVKATNYLIKKERTKRMIAKNIKELNGIWTIYDLQMTSYRGKKRQHSTILHIDKIEYNVPINDILFTERQLLKGF